MKLMSQMASVRHRNISFLSIFVSHLGLSIFTGVSLLLASHKDIISQITLCSEIAARPAGQEREADPVHLDLTFCCLVEAFSFSFSAESIHGLILTYMCRVLSFESMMKEVMKLKNKAGKAEEKETDWRERKKVNDSQGPSRHFERMDDP